MRRRTGWVVSLIAVSWPWSAAWPHHSIGGEFETDHVSVGGTVKELRLINPHAYIVLEAEGPDGAKEQWTLTMGPATKLVRGSGWTPRILEAGDRVTATGRRARRGLGMYVVELVTADGVFLIRELQE